jgi:Pyruvate/2-oxoacid:ferredoxin oxidoreductase delta subunit
MPAKYKNLLIFYFSGTGNALNCSKWIAGEAEKQGLTVHVNSIDRFEKINIPELADGRTLIGFLYPTHGFNAAPIMLRFLGQFPKLEKSDVFMVNTRAGMKLSRFFLPGLSGMAQYIPALMLLIKGYKVVAMKPADLPSNWISLHPGLKQKVVISIHDRWQRKMKNFAGKLLAGKRNYRALYELPIDLLLLPITLGYYFIGRYALAKTFIATDSCTSCQLCVKQCPTNSIKMIGDYPYWKLSCESCMRCMNSCPERAIETAHTFSGAVWYLIWALLSPFLYTIVIRSEIIPLPYGYFWTRLLDWTIVGITTVICVSIAYYLMHFLLRFRFFNKFISVTSLTHYKFWRRYKAPDAGL